MILYRYYLIREMSIVITKTDIDSLIYRLKSDASDYKNENSHSHGLMDYLEELLNDGNLSEEAAIGSVKRAISDGFSSLSDAQVRAIALDLLNNDTYMDKCPNEWCEERITWSDMSIALYEGQCCHCEYVQEKHERE